ncbi:MAG: SDR family NAD(P)-dependent oxidoreductase [Candidatus Dormibacteraceae bacterium]
MPLANPFDFSGQAVVITGPTGGLGRPIALAFAEAGADLALADVAKTPLEELAEEVRARGHRALAMTVDVRRAADLEALVKRALAEFGRIDVLVNLAGVIRRMPALEQPLDVWEQQVDVNLKGTWLACRAVAPAMLREGRGKIINFASGAGFHGFAGYPAYTPSKHAVVGLTKVLAIEWSGRGVNVNAVAPGFTDTPLNQDVLDDPERRQATLRRIPMGEVLPAESQVGPTLFLASEAARWITGFTLRVDGGFNAT